MAEILPLLLTLLKSVVLLVVLLIFVAYIIYADRKVWAGGCNCGAGRMSSAPGACGRASPT